MGVKRDLKDTMRDTKNFIKGYSRVQVKLRQATCVDPWGPSTLQMEEISRATHSPTLLGDLIYVFDRRLNDHGKYWRHVYKSLLVMEYCIICGSEAFVRYAKDTIYVIKTLKEFQYIDDKFQDRGALVRQKSRDIVALLQNESMLAEARRNKTVPQPNIERSRSSSPLSKASNKQPQGNPYDDQLMQAIEESKKTAADEARRRASGDDAFFANLETSASQRHVGSSRRGSENMTITQEQPKIILTQVPTTVVANKNTDDAASARRSAEETGVHGFMEEDPFSQVSLSEQTNGYSEDDDLFENAEEVDEKDPFKNAEEIAVEPRAQANTFHDADEEHLSVPIPKDPLDRSLNHREIEGAKPVKPMNLTPGFSTRAPANKRHYNV